MANYLADKPGVGRGCLWDTKRLEAWLAEHRPDVCLAEMWRQIRLIGRAAAQSVCAHPNVAKALKAYPHAQSVGYEVRGCARIEARAVAACHSRLLPPARTEAPFAPPNARSCSA